MYEIRLFPRSQVKPSTSRAVSPAEQPARFSLSPPTCSAFRPAKSLGLCCCRPVSFARRLPYRVVIVLCECALSGRSFA